MRGRPAKARDMDTFVNLTEYPFSEALYPTFETALSADEEMKVAEVAMANVSVSNLNTKSGRTLKVTVGRKHTAQL